MVDKKKKDFSIAKYLKKVHKRFFGQNRNYRYFVFLAWIIIWGDIFYIDLWELLWTLIFAVIPSFIITLYLVDKPFKRYFDSVCRKLRAKRKKEQIKQQKEREEEKECFKQILKLLYAIPTILFFKLMSYITILPIFDNIYSDRLGHYKNRELRKFSDLLEAGKNNKLNVTGADINQYFVTFDVKLFKPLTPKKAKDKINRTMKKYFGSIPPGAMIRLKRTTGKVCIPTELLRKDLY